MVSARRLPSFVTQKAVEVFNNTLSRISGLQYQALAQDASLGPTDATRRSRKGHAAARSRKPLAYGILILFLLLVIGAYSRHGNGISLASTSGASRHSISKDGSIAALLSEPVEGVLDTAPIRSKCDSTKFQEGLVWHCAAVVGGIGNVGNELLNCVLYAMEAGATTMILPKLGHRADNLVNLGGEAEFVDLSDLIDVDYFLESWKTACPQIRAYRTESEVPNLDLSPTVSSPHLDPSRVKNFQMRKYLIVDPTGWREAFDDWLATNADIHSMSAEKPVRIWQNLVLAQWNRETQPVDFATSFPRLFQYPKQTRRLAASALWSLEQKLARPVVSEVVMMSDPSSPAKCTSLGPGRVLGVPNGFFGAHLRVAADAAAAGWPGYEAQVPFYISEARRLNLTSIYLATGSAEHRERFRADAAKQGLDVIVKEDLLDAAELVELQSLSWDQQALVDFDVLMHSAFFYGMVRSSFTWSIALRRGLLPEAVPEPGTDRATPMPKDSRDEYRDGLSAIVQRYDQINPEGLWP